MKQASVRTFLSRTMCASGCPTPHSYYTTKYTPRNHLRTCTVEIRTRLRDITLLYFLHMPIRKLLLFFRRRGTQEEAPAGVGEIVEYESLLDRIAQYAIIAIIFLLPFFVIPSAVVPFQFTKTALVIAAVSVAAVLFAIARFRSGEIILPSHPAALAVLLVPGAYLVSALFSDTFAVSFFGQRLEVDTFGFMFAGAVLLYITTTLFRRTVDIIRAELALLAGGAILALFQLIRLVAGPDAIAFNVFNSATANLLGKWNDVGIFFALTGVLSLAALATLRRRTPLISAVIYGTLIISLIFLAVVNFFVAWAVFGFFVFAYFVYALFAASFQRMAVGGAYSAKLLMITLVLVAVSGAFIGFDSLGNSVASTFNIAQIEARPSWQSTVTVIQETYATAPIFGSGPNTFTEQWGQFRPRGINESVFWNTDFTSGVGLLPTSFATTGLVGGAAWVIFLALLALAGVRALPRLTQAPALAQFATLSTFSAAALLWLMTILYNPNAPMVVLAFVFSGLFLASLRGLGTLPLRQIVFSANPRLGFVSVFGLSLLLIVVVAGVYVTGSRYVAATSHQLAAVAQNTGDLERAEEHVRRAIRIQPYDVYHRFLTNVALNRIDQLVRTTGEPTEQARTQFQNALSVAVQSGINARDFNPNYYRNWLALARVYRSVVPLQIQGAAENAQQTLAEAKTRSPNHPLIAFEEAQLAFVRNDFESARESIREALQKKNNYTAAVFLLAQIEIQEGNLPAAIETAESATALSPNDPTVFFQLGFLQYANEQFADARDSLQQALIRDQNYANARYFLGLALHQLGDTAAAIEQFERVAQLNPDNAEVQQILTNLRAGREPFAQSDQQPPEARLQPPVSEGQ